VVEAARTSRPDEQPCRADRAGRTDSTANLVRTTFSTLSTPSSVVREEELAAWRTLIANGEGSLRALAARNHNAAIKRLQDALPRLHES